MKAPVETDTYFEGADEPRSMRSEDERKVQRVGPARRTTSKSCTGDEVRRSPKQTEALENRPRMAT